MLQTKTFLAFLFITFAIALSAMALPYTALAQDATDSGISLSKDTPEKSGDNLLSEDLQEARDALTENVSNKPFLRGLLFPLFQPVFIAIMFTFGLWTGQQTSKLSTVSAVPVVLFLSMVAAAFITSFHPEWRPDVAYGDEGVLHYLSSSSVMNVILAMAMGLIVGLQLTFAPFIALIVAIALGLAQGFGYTGSMDSSVSPSILFWIGYALTGLIFNIIGIGFETFLQSINLSVMVRLLGFACLILGFILAVSVF